MPQGPGAAGAPASLNLVVAQFSAQGCPRRGAGGQEAHLNMGGRGRAPELRAVVPGLGETPPQHQSQDVLYIQAQN